MRLAFCLISLFCFLLSATCSARSYGWEKKTKIIPLSAAEIKATEDQAMLLWKERKDQAKLAAALTKFETLHAANPNELKPLVYLARGNYFLADSHLQDLKKKKDVYEKAISFGEKGLATNAAFLAEIKAGKTLEESLGKLTVTEVPVLYWTAASLGKWAKLTGILASLKFKGDIKSMIERVEKLEPDFFFAAVPRYWGGFYAVAPSFAGGDMDKSKEQFEKSIKLAPEYLGTKVLMAEVYYTKTGEKKKFEALLKEVIDSTLENHSELGPENALEKVKAQKLLEKKGDLF